MTAVRSIPDFCKELAARTPAPGGGAAAAVAAALGCAAGAMAARYTTGPKWADREREAQALAEALANSADQAIALADADAKAYAVLGEAKKSGPTQLKNAQAQALAVPADLLALCASQAKALAQFLPRCNPHIVSDVKVAVHLIAGAGRAAWETLLVNAPDAGQRASAERQCAALAEAEAAISG